MSIQCCKFSVNKALLPWIVCLSAALFFFYEFIQMNMFNAISAELMRDFSLNATGLGALSAYYFYANLLFLPIAGALLDRFSTRLIILSALLLCIFSVLAFAQTRLFWPACTFRFMSGIGSAFCFLSSIRLASRWFPVSRMALIIGLIVTVAMLGGMVAQTPLTLLTQYLGWRTALVLDAGFGLLIFLIIFCFVQDYPSESRDVQNRAQRAPIELRWMKGWRLAYFNPQSLLCAMFAALTNLPIVLLGAIWGSLFLQQTVHLSATQASLAPSLLFIGTILGGPVIGWFSDRIQRRVKLMMSSAFLSLWTTIMMIYFLQFLSFLTILALFFVMGFLVSSQVLAYSLVVEHNSKDLTATATSLVSFFCISAYAIFQPLFGWFMDDGWQGSIVNQIREYGAGTYHHALLILPIGFCVAFLATLFIREPNRQASGR